MVDVLRRQGIRSAFVSAAGSSIYGLGNPPAEARGWKIQIGHPRDSRHTIEDVYLKDMSLSTSGAQEKFFEAGGRIYSHIFDPRTGYPAEGRLQVSVIAPRTLDSEAWTKPVFIEGRSWAAQYLPKGLRAYICEDKRELSCAWLR
jgi:thiamine biosynthesis lipoprotein